MRSGVGVSCTLARFQNREVVRSETFNESRPTEAMADEVTKSVRLVFVDNSGQRRCRVIPTSRFESIIKEEGVGLTQSYQGFPSFIDGPVAATGLTAVGEIRLVPDVSTRKVIPWFPSQEFSLAFGKLDSETNWDLCSRTVLQRVLNQLNNEFQLDCQVGFESEFYLLHKIVPEVVPFDNTPYCSSFAVEAAAEILEDMVTNIQKLDISVEQFHSEAGRGQFEISYAHSSALKAADDLIYVREAIRAVAHRHNLIATFLPRVFENEVGSGCHAHVSITRDGKNVFGEEGSKHGISEEGEHFLAGVLNHLPALLALSAPHPLSYFRLQPNTWSGAFKCWGIENREASLRVCRPPGIKEGFSSNFEVKCSDAMANPYNFLAGLIASGMDGLRRKLTLPEPIDVNPADLADHSVERLPESLSAATKAFQADEVMKEALGEKLWNCIAAIRKAEDEYAKGKNFDELIKNLWFKY